MANRDAPFGFRPYRRLGGGAPSPVSKYTIADALAENIGYGNLVSRSGTNRNVINAIDGVAGATIVGVFMGCEYQNARGEMIYSPNWVSATATKGAAGAVAYVMDDPRSTVITQMSAGLAAADPGQFAGLVIAAPSAFGVSTWEANSADISGTLDNLKILGLVDRAGNELGANGVVECLIAFHEYGDGTLRAS